MDSRELGAAWTAHVFSDSKAQVYKVFGELDSCLEAAEAAKDARLQCAAQAAELRRTFAELRGDDPQVGV